MIFDRILGVIRKHEEWKQDKVIKTEKIYEKTYTQNCVGNGLLNDGMLYYITVELSAYVETHKQKGCLFYKENKIWNINSTLSKDHHQYNDFVLDAKESLEMDFEKVYYEYCNNIKS